jgi:hypothetical protein
MILSDEFTTNIINNDPRSVSDTSRSAFGDYRMILQIIALRHFYNHHDICSMLETNTVVI